MNNQDKRGGIQQPKGTVPGNGKVVKFPGQPPTQPPPTDEQLASMKRIDVASQNIMAAMNGLTLMEATGVLKTVEGMIQQHVAKYFQTEKLGEPEDAKDSTETEMQ